MSQAPVRAEAGDRLKRVDKIFLGMFVVMLGATVGNAAFVTRLVDNLGRDLRGEIHALRTEVRDEIGVLREAVADLSERVTRLEERVTRIEERLTGVEERVTRIESVLTDRLPLSESPPESSAAPPER